MNNATARARWFRLIPIAVITYSLSYLDRANFGFGVAGSMAEDLKITSATSSLLGSLFFPCYFSSRYPGPIMLPSRVQKK